MGILIRTTFEIITEESAEYGDAAERGFYDEDGTEYSFRELVELLENCEHSGNNWATLYGDMDYYSGEYENISYHPVSERDKRYFEKASRSAGILS